MIRALKAALTAIILALSLAAPVAAGPYEDGDAAFFRGDYATALVLYRTLADQGYAGPQSNLGTMYANGLGVPQDYAEAAKWYRKAADQGDASAQYSLGNMYDNGRGVPQNYAEAVMVCPVESGPSPRVRIGPLLNGERHAASAIYVRADHREAA